MTDAADGEASLGWHEITDVSFSGMRFVGHALEVDALGELQLFQSLVSQLAAEMWRVRNPERERLPRGFERLTKFRFRVIRDGSATLPLEVPTTHPESLLEGAPSTYAVAAVDLLWRTIKSQEDEEPLPADLPRETALPLLARLGSSLNSDESLSFREARGGSERVPTLPRRAVVSRAIRERLASHMEGAEDVYEDVGHSVALRLPSGKRVRFGYPSTYEGPLLQAFQRSAQVSVTATGRISLEDGLIKSISAVTAVASIDPPSHSSLEAIVASAADLDWSRVPTDLASDVDGFLNGAKPR